MTFKRPISYNFFMGKTEQYPTIHSQFSKNEIYFEVFMCIVIIDCYNWKPPQYPMIRILVMTSLIQVTLKREECKHENPLFFYIAQSFGEDKRDHLSTLELSQTIREWFLFLSSQSTIHSTATTNRFQNCQIVGLQETSHFKRPLWNGM